MPDCSHVTRMSHLEISETCATADHTCVLCGVMQWSESWNLTRWSDEKRGAIVAKLRAEFTTPPPAQADLFGVADA